jgi:hypothetical protein
MEHARRDKTKVPAEIRPGGKLDILKPNISKKRCRKITTADAKNIASAIAGIGKAKGMILEPKARIHKS